ncbi:MAG: DUF983 domain-containing protein [Ferrovibrio sp.]|nr:DUF983 domain-containing protein [Ferrovibrio sp.]MCW0234617.1 DUF983 domain-containing protein [Ferrovibrio sp.]
MDAWRFTGRKIMSEDNAHFAPVDPVKAGLSACCPRCGQGRLFDGLTKLKPRCSNCGLDYSFADSGDGPAIFVILLADLIVVGLAVWTEINYQPPVWLHFVLFGPMAIFVSLWLLRTIKALLIALQYKNSAAQGTIDRG